MSTEERITELEIQFTHQDDLIADLNEVILAQQKSIDHLESRLLKMEVLLKSLSSSNVEDASEEIPPPHY